MAVLPKASDYRRPSHPVEPIFYNRWSPRSMSGEPITQAEFDSLLEAARWAPSSMNEQPWRFLYAFRGDAAWPVFFNLLVPKNQEWTVNAAALVVVVSKQTFTYNDKPNRVYPYDAGSAWMSFALQGSAMGLVVHGMAGFDAEKARTDLKIPDDFAVMAMAAVGRPGDPDRLPEGFRKNEFPSGRKSIEEISMRGGWAQR